MISKKSALHKLILGLYSLTLIACAAIPKLPTPTPSRLAPATAAEQPVHIIPLAAPLNKPNAEISGMAWYGDQLILLPQYPSRFNDSLFAIAKSDINAYLAGQNTNPLTAKPIPFSDAGLSTSIPGFEGFEAIAFVGERIFLTVESKPSLVSSKMLGYLVEGTVTPNLSRIRLSSQKLRIEPQAELSNTTDETIVAGSDRILTLYEANGSNVNPKPKAHVFELTTGLTPQPSIPFPNIEYRITDATPMDANGKFWVINYMFPGDAAKLQPAKDPIASKYGLGPTHAKSQAVERLLELQLTPSGVVLTDRAPIVLKLADDGQSRNWEGIAMLDQRGFLLVTDQHPNTILAFVGR